MVSGSVGRIFKYRVLGRKSAEISSVISLSPTTIFNFKVYKAASSSVIANKSSTASISNNVI